MHCRQPRLLVGLPPPAARAARAWRWQRFCSRRDGIEFSPTVSGRGTPPRGLAIMHTSCPEFQVTHTPLPTSASGRKCIPSEPPTADGAWRCHGGGSQARPSRDLAWKIRVLGEVPGLGQKHESHRGRWGMTRFPHIVCEKRQLSPRRKAGGSGRLSWRLLRGDEGDGVQALPQRWFSPPERAMMCGRRHRQRTRPEMELSFGETGIATGRRFPWILYGHTSRGDVASRQLLSSSHGQ